MTFDEGTVLIVWLVASVIVYSLFCIFITFFDFENKRFINIFKKKK